MRNPSRSQRSWTRSTSRLFRTFRALSRAASRPRIDAISAFAFLAFAVSACARAEGDTPADARVAFDGATPDAGVDARSLDAAPLASDLGLDAVAPVPPPPVPPPVPPPPADSGPRDAGRLDPGLSLPDPTGTPCETPGNLGECSGTAQVCRFYTPDEGRCESCVSCGNLGAPCSASNECDILFMCFLGRCTNFCHLGTFECGRVDECLDVGHATIGVCLPS